MASTRFACCAYERPSSLVPHPSPPCSLFASTSLCMHVYYACQCVCPSMNLRFIYSLRCPALLVTSASWALVESSSSTRFLAFRLPT
eukprot:4112162-Pleurochrysis_carterae.AAC.5